MNAKMKAKLSDGFDCHVFACFDVHTLVIESEVLRQNPLGDSHLRRHPVLVPRGAAPASGWPVVFVLSGFTGSGHHAFNFKTFESNTPEVLDRCAAKGEAPLAVYVFVDAMTSWGGSQFLNSQGMGRYEDHIADEIRRAVSEQFQVTESAERWCVTGGSSGGYGALHLASRYPRWFGVAAAIAPDSFFEASLLPEIYQALPLIEKLGGVVGVRRELEAGKLTKRKDSHVLLNVIAMGLCYAGDGRGDFDLPVERVSGKILSPVWEKWLRHDPVVFLRDRAAAVRELKNIYLDVGTRDQFHLQFGTRQIRQVLSEIGLVPQYSEFDGTHWDIAERRPYVWKWLKTLWG
jgi:enterochelin esterase-like enzyme